MQAKPEETNKGASFRRGFSAIKPLTELIKPTLKKVGAVVRDIVVITSITTLATIFTLDLFLRTRLYDPLQSPSYRYAPNVYDDESGILTYRRNYELTATRFPTIYDGTQEEVTVTAWHFSNSLGMRDEEPPFGNTNKLYALVVGDSMTVGVHVPYAYVWTSGLNTILEKKGSSWRVLNGAIETTNTVEQLDNAHRLIEEMKNHDPPLDISAVIVAYYTMGVEGKNIGHWKRNLYGDDGMRTILPHGFFSSKEGKYRLYNYALYVYGTNRYDHIYHTALKWSPEAVVIAVWCMNGMLPCGIPAMPLDVPVSYVYRYEDTEIGRYEATYNALRKFRKLADYYGITPIMASIPDFWDPAGSAEITKKVEQIAQTFGITFIAPDISFPSNPEQLKQFTYNAGFGSAEKHGGNEWHHIITEGFQGAFPSIIDHLEQISNQRIED